MDTQDIEHLAGLARIKLADGEAEKLVKEIDPILAYVGQVSGVVGEKGGAPEKPAQRNVMREDADPHEPGLYTDELLTEAPAQENGYVKVKKIL